ncbi:MAG: hypothetical protein PHU41_04335, partial [Sulfuricurvum sp.]|nr:hypothetical protein [Sulfuricurvum sp.]
MTEQERVDKAIEEAMQLWPTSIPKAWIDEIRKLPIIGDELTNKLLELNEKLGELNPIKSEAEEAIKNIAHTLLSNAENINEFLKEMGLDNGLGPNSNNPTPNDPSSPNDNPNNPGGGGTSPSGTTPGGDTPGGGGTSPGGTSPGGTTPGGGGTSPGGTTPGGGTSPNGHPHPYNPATPQPHDPLVLDMNKDGKISTIALADSQVFFDITGDGVKERVGWIAPQDGLLVYDKNRNGTIDGISEVFGKDGISGFAELRAVADTNHDNIIDRRDELYSQLKVWQDTNGDGISQANELKTLSQAGVKNIELNVIGTNINLGGNILSEAGRYGDNTGDRQLAAGETYATFDINILNDTKKESTETFYTLVDTVRTTHGAHVDFTLTDVQPFTIEDDDTDNGGGGNP